MSTHAHTEYTYDVSPGQSNPSSKANRLLRYDVYDAPNGTPIRDVSYGYDIDGHVSQIVRHASSSSDHYATLLYYKNRSQLWLAIDETWTVGQTNTCQRTKVREFRTDSPRQRYMVQSRDPNSTDPPLQPLGNAVWTDYAGNTALRDYAIQIEEPEPPNEQLGLSETDLRYQSPGDWQADATEAPIFYHTDHLGTTRLMTNELGQIVQYQAFTAFGEPIDSLTQPAQPLSRYGYAGAWGYQGLPQEQAATDNFPYLHVGARYYDPEIGRFLQRDPIGIDGGLNTYAYVMSTPTQFVDPSGLVHIGGPGPSGGMDPLIRPPPGQWLSPPEPLPIGSPGYKFVPGVGWVPRLVTPPSIPWLLRPVTAITPGVCGAVAGAALIGYGAGRGLDNAVQWATGTSISDWGGNLLYRVAPNGPWSWFISMLGGPRISEPTKDDNPLNDPIRRLDTGDAPERTRSSPT